MPTDQRLRQFGALGPGLVALHAQYGLYLLIASSRRGTQPPNLQGIWNDKVRAPWSSNWTIDAGLSAVLAKLHPLQIGPDGRLQEWFRPFAEAEVHHRHLSHLWGLYPGNQITRATPDLRAASRRSLEVRSDEGTGWSSGWKISLWARLGDGDHAFKLIGRTLRLGPGGVYPNLFGSHPPFQMDGNFAFPAGVAELLLQSHASDGEIHLLPALPKAWPTGSVTGLRARGGFGVDIAWQDGTLSSATIRSQLGRQATVRYGEQTVPLAIETGGRYEWDGQVSFRLS